jgi:hypothetical protein
MGRETTRKRSGGSMKRTHSDSVIELSVFKLVGRLSKQV